MDWCRSRILLAKSMPTTSQSHNFTARNVADERPPHPHLQVAGSTHPISVWRNFIRLFWCTIVARYYGWTYFICSLRFETKVTFGEISLQLRQTDWKFTINIVNVDVVDDLPSQITVYTCLTIHIWTWRRRCTSTRFYVFRCHPPKMAGFQWNWCRKFSTLLWTTLARREVLSESYATHMIFVLKVWK